MSLRHIPLAIVGAGPAGLAASIHAARAGIDHVLFDPDPPGGLLRAARLIENVPGMIDGLSGVSMADRMVAHAQALGVIHYPCRVTAIERTGGGFVVRASSGLTLPARAVILATGTRPRPLRVPGVSGAGRKGLFHRDARTLPTRMSGLNVVISGGGEAALDTALNARDRGATVQIHFRGAGVSANAALCGYIAAAAIPLHPGHSLSGVRWTPEGLRVHFRRGRQAEAIVTCDHLVACHGRDAGCALWRMAAGPAAPPPADVRTSVPGLFCGGDLIRGGCRYASVASGDGTRAGHLAAEYLMNVESQGSGVQCRKGRKKTDERQRQVRDRRKDREP